MGRSSESKMNKEGMEKRRRGVESMRK